SRNCPSRTSAAAALLKKSAALARASSARASMALRTHQVISSFTPASIQERIAPPAPISMSSEWAPSARTRSVSPGRARPSALISAAPRTVGVDAPRHLALLGHGLEILAILQRVHRAPEAVIAIGHQLALRDQAIERIDHQLFAVLHVVEEALA